MKLISAGTSRKGHYSSGVELGDTLYISGQLPVDPKTGTVIEGGIEAQTSAVLANLERVLREAGLEKTDVAMCRLYISDSAQWDAVNSTYAEFFGDHRPARVIVPVGPLHYGALVEIEAVAERRRAQ